MLPTVEKLLDFLYHLAGELHQMQQQLCAVKIKKYNSEICEQHTMNTFTKEIPVHDAPRQELDN
jgi:hypothetical protein